MEQRTYRIYFLPGQTPRVIGQVQAEHLSANLVGASAGLSIDGNAYLTGWLAIHPSWRLRLERLLRLGPAPEMVAVSSLLTFSNPSSTPHEEHAFLQSLKEEGQIVCWDQAERPSFRWLLSFLAPPPFSVPLHGSLSLSERHACSLQVCWHHQHTRLHLTGLVDETCTLFWSDDLFVSEGTDSLLFWLVPGEHFLLWIRSGEPHQTQGVVATALLTCRGEKEVRIEQARGIQINLESKGSLCV